MKRLAVPAVAALLAGAGPARAECTAPVPPAESARPPKLAPPVKSACVDAKPGAAGCLGWEAYTYNDQVKAYNAGLPAFKVAADAYVAKLNAYVSASADYARCEIKAMQ